MVAPRKTPPKEETFSERKLREYNETWAAQLMKARAATNKRADAKLSPNHRKKYNTGYE